MSHHYKNAIEQISKKLDWFEVAKHYAQHHPASFVRACESQDGWGAEARKLLADGKKIDAIKLCRNETGMGLKEAKEAVELL